VSEERRERERDLGEENVVLEQGAPETALPGEKTVTIFFFCRKISLCSGEEGLTRALQAIGVVDNLADTEVDVIDAKVPLERERVRQRETRTLGGRTEGERPRCHSRRSSIYFPFSHGGSGDKLSSFVDSLRL
jgi:hypothetical protein